MASIFQGTGGKQYLTQDPPLGRGGEGVVYAIINDPNHVLKVYHTNNQTSTRERKLLAMLKANISPDAMKQIAWPVDVVYENGKFVGFVMPKASDIEELNVMYSDKYICTLAEKITMAKNICVAVNAVHDAGQVCGDLNPKNIAVNVNQGTVMLVDTDSYHITDGSHDYRCEVGMPEYLPPEVQAKMRNGMTLANAPLPTFSIESDRFALAVHIFALLMNSCHPFACSIDLSQRQRSVVAPQPVDNIRNGVFPFVQKQSGISIPAYAPEFTYLPDEIQQLFKRAFIDGHSQPTKRPSAAEWFFALDNMSKSLQVCAVDKHHMYPITNKACPWCDVANKMSRINQIATATATATVQTSYNTPPYTTHTTPTLHTPPNRGTTTSTNKGFNYKGIVAAVVTIIVIAIIAYLAGAFGGGKNEYPVHVSKLTQRSATSSDYVHRNDPAYYIKANYSYQPERYRPFTVNLEGKYDRFHMGYYLYNQWGEEGGIRFTVYADGRSILDTGYLPYGTDISSYPAQINYVDLNVAGVNELELRADYNGASGTYDSQEVVVVNAYAYNAEWNVSVFDDARVLTADQKRKMEEKIHQIRDKYGIDIMVITTTDSQGSNLKYFADSYYSNHRNASFSDRIIVMAYFDGKTTGLGYYTKVYTSCDIYSYGSTSNNIKNSQLSGQGLQYFWNKMDDQEYNSAFLNVVYSIENYYGD